MSAASALARAALATALLFGGTPIASGQESLEPIVVRAPEPRTGDVVVEDHVGTRSHVDRETLERRDLTLDDVIAREAGVQRRRSGGFGSFASLTVRAASPAQTAVLLDGVRLNSAGNPVVDLSTLELLALDGVDIYRGVTPLQFGQGAIGGAVNLLTPRAGDEPPSTRLGFGLASFGTVRAEAAHVGRHGRWDTVAALGATSADNDYPFVDGNGTPLNASDDRRVRRRNGEARRVGALLKLGTRHGERARSDLLVQAGTRHLGVPEWRNAADNEASFDTDTLQLQASHSRDGVGPWDTRHTLFVHAQDDRFDDPDRDVGLVALSTLARGRTLGLDSYWTRPLGAGTFDANLELRRETLDGFDRLVDASTVEARRRSALLGARWSAYAADGRLVLSPTLRWQASDDRLEGGARRAGGAASRGARDLLPAFGARLDLGETTTLHASLGRHVREPSFAELYVDRGLVRGNPGLVAERGLDADAGIEWSSGGALELAATVFASERDELIVTTFDARGIGHAINTGRARVLGLELGGRWTPAPAWRLDANATLQDARNLSPNAVLDGRQLPGEARLQLHAAVRYRPAPRWLLRLEADASRGRYYDQANRRPAEDRVLANAGLEHVRGSWRTAFSIDNLGDDNVEDFNGFPRPGRAFALQVTLTPRAPSR